MAEHKKKRFVSSRVYDPADMVGVPAWRIVLFPNGQTFKYDSLEAAQNARIIARAWAKVREKPKPNGRPVGWSDFARHLNYTTNPRITNKGDPRSQGLSASVSNKIYGHVQRGTLPDEEHVKRRLIQLSGFPWD